MKGQVAEQIRGFVGVVVGLVVAVALIPVVNESIISANLTGVQGSLLSLVLTLFIIGIVAYVVRTVM